jgi:hypothetical protein
MSAWMPTSATSVTISNRRHTDYGRDGNAVNRVPIISRELDPRQVVSHYTSPVDHLCRRSADISIAASLLAVIDDGVVRWPAHQTADLCERVALFREGVGVRCEGLAVHLDGKREAAFSLF